MGSEELVSFYPVIHSEEGLWRAGSGDEGH